MRIAQFSADDVADESAGLSDGDLDSLAFGAIERDRDGRILRYDSAEADVSGRQQEGMIGRDFFAEVAPCTRSVAFEGRFRAGVEAYRLDVQLTYVLYEMAPTEVRSYAQS